MTALAAAVSRRLRWEFRQPGLTREAPYGELAAGGVESPLAVVDEFGGGYRWRVFHDWVSMPFDGGTSSTPDAALDAAERAVDAVVTR